MCFSLLLYEHNLFFPVSLPLFVLQPLWCLLNIISVLSCVCPGSLSRRRLPGLIWSVLSVSSFLSQGVFIQLVQANSPAALAGLRFGDQVLQINGQNCAGWSVDKAHKALKAAAETRIELVVRDR